MTARPTPGDAFESIVAPLLFGRTEPTDEPTLTLVLGTLSSGRSRATGRIHAQDAPDAAVVNAGDLRSFTFASVRPNSDDATGVAAEWLQQSLAYAREQRRSLIIEGNFHSPALVTRIVRLFRDAGFHTRLVAVADRDTETQLSATSVQLEHVRAGEDADPHVDIADIVEVLRTVSIDAAIDRVTILRRDGDVVFDGAAPETGGGEAAAAFEAAQREPLGTLRSTLWLSELRHASQFARSVRDLPDGVAAVLVDLHEVALGEIVPELPIPAESDARRIQDERLRASLAELRELATTEVRKSRTPELQEDLTRPVVSTGPDHTGPSL